MSAFAREHEVATAAARAAGALIRRYYEGGVEFREKGHDNPVSAADEDADRYLRETLTGAFPDYGWLSEETKDSPARLTRSRVWIVDPLDGTKEFRDHIPEFCVCIGLVEDGQPVLGVSYNPATEALYAALRGQGTTCNGRPVRVSTQRTVREARVLASRSEDKRGEWDPFKNRVQVVLTGSVAFKLAQLSGGDGDATFTLTPKNEWDICSGSILVEEAGGRVTDLTGKPLVWNQPKTLRPGMIASNGVLHDGLLALIREVDFTPAPSRR